MPVISALSFKQAEDRLPVRCPGCRWPWRYLYWVLPSLLLIPGKSPPGPWSEDCLRLPSLDPPARDIWRYQFECAFCGFTVAMDAEPRPCAT